MNPNVIERTIEQMTVELKVYNPLGPGCRW